MDFCGYFMYWVLWICIEQFNPFQPSTFINDMMTHFILLNICLQYETFVKNIAEQSAPHVCGLSNLGNTCYLNAALQRVYGTAAFKDAFMKCNWFSCTCIH